MSRTATTPTTEKREDHALRAGSAIDLLEELLIDAHARGASDIHLDPSLSRLGVRFRIDGILADARSVPLSIHHELLSRIKVLAGLRTDEHQCPQDGRFRFDMDDGFCDIRVSIAPTYHGENAVLRLLTPLSEGFTLEHLGLAPQEEGVVRVALKKPHGMILVTGPTGSGKTSTLYSLIKILNSRDVSIITVEDPIEYSIEGINQIPAREREGLTFSSGLRSILRQDPDVIMVGEIRDPETAGLAVNAALTGHLVLSTLHTSDAPTALPRLMDMKVEPYLLASTVNLVIAERLVRRICEACKVETQLSAAEAKALSAALGMKLARSYFRGQGCNACAGSGYKGRVGIFEVMTLTETLRDSILRKSSARELRAGAEAAGMRSMTEDGLMKAAQGITTLEEVLRTRYE